jgi:hypothetical protein
VPSLLAVCRQVTSLESRLRDLRFRLFVLAPTVVARATVVETSYFGPFDDAFEPYQPDKTTLDALGLVSHVDELCSQGDRGAIGNITEA